MITCGLCGQEARTCIDDGCFCDNEKCALFGRQCIQPKENKLNEFQRELIVDLCAKLEETESQNVRLNGHATRLATECDELRVKIAEAERERDTAVANEERSRCLYLTDAAGNERRAETAEARVKELEEAVGFAVDTMSDLPLPPMMAPEVFESILVKLKLTEAEE